MYTIKINKMTDLQILKELENQLNVEFEEIDINVIYSNNWEKTAKYSIDNQFNIIGLKIFDIKIDDLLLISKLINIETLSLRENKITDISVLENLKQIRSFDLSNNQIKDISVLENLKQIDWLNLSNNQIKDISPIKSLFKKNRFLCDFKNNPLKYPPKEIAELSIDAVKEYFEQANIN